MKQSLVDCSTLSPAFRRLVRAAKNAARNAYCPYSQFNVGAAVLCDDGTIFTGCNIESCSSGATICAERVAVFKAVSEGHRQFTAIAIFAPAAPKTASSCGCGICRQVLAEFGLHILVLKLRNDGKVIRKTLRQLLPNAFVPSIVRPQAPPAVPASPPKLVDISRAITASLTPDLLKKQYRESARNKFTGHCYVASEALHHMLGGRTSDYVPQTVRHEGSQHWYLRHKTTRHVVDLTKRQFFTPVPYENGRGSGFLTRQPSKRAQILISRAQARLDQKLTAQAQKGGKK